MHRVFHYVRSHFTVSSSQLRRPVCVLWHRRACIVEHSWEQHFAAWRLRKALWVSLSAFEQVLDTGEVFQELLPHILEQLHHGALLEKRNAAQVLAEHFIHSSGGRQTGGLYRVLVVDFYAGESCWQRTGFLLFCKACLHVLDAR